MKWLLCEWEQYGGMICLCLCVSERKEEDVHLIGEVGWALDFADRQLLRFQEVTDQLIFKKSRRISGGEPLSIPIFQASDIIFSIWNWQTYHPPSWFSFMYVQAVSVCLSEWITSNHPADRQLSRLTFSEQGEEHSEISIRLPSPVSIVCVGPLRGISPPPSPPPPPLCSKLEPFGIQITANSSDLLEQ